MQGKGRESRGREDLKRTETTRKGTMPKKIEKEQKAEVRCYNCGAKDHISNDCNIKELGKKCFKCHKFGHMAINCNENNEGKPSVSMKSPNVNIVSTPVANNMHKEIVINNVRVKALIDTGSQITIICESIYSQLKLIRLHNFYISLTGFGKNKIDVLG